MSQLTLDDLYQKALAAAAAKEKAQATPTANQDFGTQLEVFLAWARQVVEAYYKKNFPKSTVPTLDIDDGKRYVRIWKSDGPSSRSAWGFIDKTNGNILKADGWKRPAPQKRGNIFERENWSKWVSPYGPAYLK